ncbi:hypothetical protein LTR62_006729 [Meristemomyces frigidus]|uniref:Metallo-beta-lactamase domain-containing protein n=1 Tax=Meristemomyces frigidus TaxID=1508187 RepID=A0AAN7TNT2_9PEZI|nr:hypothetical protein LTR62_006729 [Meristemomyces frigidus]
MSQALDINIRRDGNATPPDHHVFASNEPAAGWSSYLPSWNNSSGPTRAPKETKERKVTRSSTSSISSLSTRSLTKTKGNGSELTGFRNPWPSWHKPTKYEVWQSLEWGDDTDPCIGLAATHLNNSPACNKSLTRQQQADQLLGIQKPDFTYDITKQRITATWLGHAGMLLQLPPLAGSDRPVRCLFDPIFSMRCSPTQAAGPIRSYVPPCKVEDLPAVDVVVISHSHYDHLDYDTMMQFWKQHSATVRYLVPLGNKKWFVECGIDADRVTELDWWESVQLAPLQSSSFDGASQQAIEVTCTPSQHNSGRGLGTDDTLWCSWYFMHPSARAGNRPYRIYFGGDTGYQFHDSPDWPPSPPTNPTERAQLAKTIATKVDNDDSSATAKHPTCPAFKEIRARLGIPHLLVLPVAVGATYDFFRSFAPVPDSINPIPRLSQGVTAHNHMPSWDAVRVLNVMTAGATSPEAEGEDSDAPVAIAVHWGTFVTEPVEILATLGQLQWACEAHGVEFARSLGERRVGGSKGKKACFLALNHGESVAL